MSLVQGTFSEAEFRSRSNNSKNRKTVKGEKSRESGISDNAFSGTCTKAPPASGNSVPAAPGAEEDKPKGELASVAAKIIMKVSTLPE